MANFSPGRNFIQVSETNPPKINCKLSWRRIQPGLKILAFFNGPGNLKKSHVIETEFQLGLKSEHMRSDFVFPGNKMAVATKPEKRFQWNKDSLDMRNFFLQHQSGTSSSSPIIFCHHWSVRPFITQTDLRFWRTRRAWRFLSHFFSFFANTSF